MKRTTTSASLPPSAGRGAWIALLAAGLVAAAGLWLLLGRDGPADDPTDVAPELQRQRELAAAYFEEDDRARAVEAVDALIARDDATARDLVSAALVYWLVADEARHVELLRRALERDPDDAAVHYNLGVYYARRKLDVEAGDLERAAEHLQRARELAPDDVPTRLHLAAVLEDLDRPDEAEELYRSVVALGPDFAGSWTAAALYRLRSLLVQSGRTQEADEVLAQFTRLGERGITPPRDTAFDRGNLGRVPHPPPRGNRAAPVAFEARVAGPRRIDLAEPAEGVARAATDLLAIDLNNDGRLDLVACGPRGVALALQGEDGAFEGRVVDERPAERALAFDLGNDDDLDLVLVQGRTLRLLEGLTPQQSGVVDWAPWSKSLPDHPGVVRDLIAVDFDHEGDLDLLVVGEGGARLLRNDGAAAAEGGGFTDVTAEAGLPRDRSFAWCLAEDLDTDQDVDLLLGGPDGTHLASSLRGGRFEDASERIDGGLAADVAPVVADLDGDGRPDLWAALPGATPDALRSGALWLGRASGHLERAGETPGLPAVPLGRIATADVDLDGSLDALWAGADALVVGRLGLGLPGERAWSAGPGLGAAGVARQVLCDLDADYRLDVVRVGDEGLAVATIEGAPGHALLLGFRGTKDNRRGIGTVVELRAGDVYRRIFWGGEYELVGVGPEARVDWTRLTWPNGVVQYMLRHELGDWRAEEDLVQTEGQSASCPFLYTWNGETFTFVSDVLGITPLGLPMAPGVLVPPDHDEYVLVTAEQMAPRDGGYELQVTEELREVTYLDRVRLDVVDHPEGTEVYPDERFTLPPFPAPHVHTVRDPLSPVAARGSDGSDLTRELAAVDDVYAAPFTPARRQFFGLARPHWIELAFDPDAVRDAPRLRLLLTGWFYWTNASVNLASARHPEWDFVPPILQVPDGAGGWRDTGPPVGFPAGKTKTMVLDVTELLPRDDPRLRVVTTLRLAWDAARLAVDADDAELVVHRLEPSSARLWERGFSAHAPDERPLQPERFLWDELEPLPLWNPHPGLYTRLGDVLPLLGEIDDRYAILAAGDALHVRFDAADLPPPRPGFRRDFLVFLDGWAKDRDPNTLQATAVEPLPFHGMSGYPYGPDERFPDDDAHRRWRAEWNTRPGRVWIPVGPELVAEGFPGGAIGP